MTETIKPLPLKTHNGDVSIKCPYCGRWNEVKPSQLYYIEKEKRSFYTMSFYMTCENCEKDLYFDLKSVAVMAEVLVEE